jgi:hypothetical protein
MSAPSSDKAAIRQVIRALRAAGHVPESCDDGEEVTDLTEDTEDQMIAALMSTDSSSLDVRLANGERSWIYFVLGNEPFEVICDHHVNLCSLLDTLTADWED